MAGKAELQEYSGGCLYRLMHFYGVLSAKLDDVPFVSLFWVESHWKGGPSAHCLM